MEFSRVWSKIVEILALTAPFWLLLFGVDVTDGLDVFEELGVHLTAVIVAVKDLYQIIAGYFKSGAETVGQYFNWSYLAYEKAVQMKPSN
jgi:hypothetical protein